LISGNLSLLDLHVPALDDEELVKKIIRDPKLTDTKVVFLTSLITKQEVGDDGRKIEKHVFWLSRLILRFLFTLHERKLPLRDRFRVISSN